jgi:hypothetical protein
MPGKSANVVIVILVIGGHAKQRFALTVLI